MAETLSKTHLEDACVHLAEALQDLAAQCSGFGLYLESAGQTRETALEAQGPVRGAALQAIELTESYLTMLTDYADGLPD